MRVFIESFLASESGATAIEYGLIITLIAVVIVTAASLMGTNIGSAFNSASSGLTPAS